MNTTWWLKKLIQDPVRIGSVAPSSKALAELMTRDIPVQAQVLELGPGSGAITEFILAKISDSTRLTLVEADPDMHQICKNRFSGATVQLCDAEDYLQRDSASYGCIVSGIPFASMDKAKRNRVFNLIRERLRDDGSFTMFQYSLTTLDELKNIFGSVRISFTLFNLPPAFVFSCKK